MICPTRSEQDCYGTEPMPLSFNLNNSQSKNFKKKSLLVERIIFVFLVLREMLLWLSLLGRTMEHRSHGIDGKMSGNHDHSWAITEKSCSKTVLMYNYIPKNHYFFGQCFVNYPFAWLHQMAALLVMFLLVRWLNYLLAYMIKHPNPLTRFLSYSHEFCFSSWNPWWSIHVVVSFLWTWSMRADSSISYIILESRRRLTFYT